MAVGKKTWCSRTRLALVCSGLVALVYACSNGDENLNGPRPFTPSDGISVRELCNERTEPAGMTGHQQVFMVWTIEAPTDDIDRLTSSNVVRDGLYWQRGHSEQFNKSLSFFQLCSKYEKVAPAITNILTDPDVRYGYKELSVSNGRIAWASMWICSPKAKKIAFLSNY